MEKENISWKLIDTYFKDNPTNLVSHHLESFNELFQNGIKRIFKENNPIRFIEREEEGNLEHRNEVMLYLGGKDGKKIYFPKKHHTKIIFFLSKLKKLIKCSSRKLKWLKSTRYA